MRKFSSMIAAMALMVFASVANAWEPTGPVNVTITAPAGSLHDRVFKTVLPTLEEQTGLEFIVDYKPGAASTKGTKHYLGLDATGQNIFLTASLSLVLSDISHPQIATWDYLNDFKYTSGIAQSTTTVTSSKFNTMEELVAAIKGGDSLVVATTYPNSEALVRLLVAEVGGNIANVKFIKYKNPSAALTDVVGGTADLFVSGISPGVPLYKAGKVNFLAVTSEERLSFLPDVPTLSDYVPGLVMSVDMGVNLHADAPAGAAEYWEAAITRAVRTEAAKKAREKNFLNLDEAFIGTEGQVTYYIKNRHVWADTYREMF
jgi:tripartite-type tricarboxylate transporter receptor subunit TctC